MVLLLPNHSYWTYAHPCSSHIRGRLGLYCTIRGIPSLMFIELAGCLIEDEKKGGGVETCQLANVFLFSPFAAIQAAGQVPCRYIG